MTKREYILMARMACSVLLSVAATAALFYGMPILVVPIAFVIVINSHRQIRQMQRSIRDVKRLVEAIEFSEFNISFILSPQLGADEELVDEMKRVIGNFNKRMVEKERQLNFYETLLNRVDFGIIVADTSGKITWINKHALDLVKRPHLYSLADLNDLSPQLSSLFEKLVPKEIKTVRLQRDDNSYHLAITVAKIINQGRSLSIFSLKNVQPLLDETESFAWDKLILTLTHEIMNSMAPIVSLSESFSDRETKADPEMMTKAIETIYRRSKGLIKFINDYKQLSYIATPHREKFRVLEMVEDIARLLQSQEIRFAYSVTPPGLELRGDRCQLEQVVINLIKNAWEACSGCSEPQINVVVQYDLYRSVVITVSDNGAGIVPEALNKLFIPFFTTKRSGSGIGLSICRQIIANHGGNISVTSKIDVGSTFIVRL